MAPTFEIPKKKGFRQKARKPLILLAPRPGLEPGTCGLTEIQARQKPNKINDLYLKRPFV
jgi:hypothetical protein